MNSCHHQKGGDLEPQVLMIQLFITYIYLSIIYLQEIIQKGARQNKLKIQAMKI